MIKTFNLSNLIPPEFTVLQVSKHEDTVMADAKAKAECRTCPSCRSVSYIIHSQYQRTVLDLQSSVRIAKR